MDSLILPTRRTLLRGLIATAICAPAIVRASSLMPVKAFKFSTDQAYKLDFGAEMARYIDGLSGYIADFVAYGSAGVMLQHSADGIMWHRVELP